MSTRIRRHQEGHFNGHNGGTHRSTTPGVLDRSPVMRPTIPGRAGTVITKLPDYARQFEQRAIELASRRFEVAARVAIFIIYFWFGFLKLTGVSPATPLAAALTSHTIGMQYFNMSFKALAVYECALGILFLIPALTRASVVLLVIHMGIVTSPLVIVANVAWIHPLVPTLEGQYIIKDLAIIALAIGLIARLPRGQRETEGGLQPASVSPPSEPEPG